VPFTFSHPAAVIPLDYISKRWFSLTALVVGSTVPDFEYFLRMRVSSAYSHTWGGLFWYDLPLGLIAFLIYQWLVKDKLITHLPRGINNRFSHYQNAVPKSSGTTYVAVVVISILIGAPSHILWDSFTLPAGYFVRHHHILKHKVMIANQSVAFYNMLQDISTAVGAIIVGYAIYKQPKGRVTSVTPGKIVSYWIAIVFIALVVVGIRLVTGLSIAQYGDVIMSTISGFLIGLILVSLFTPVRRMA